MDWPEFSESYNSQDPMFDLFGASLHDNREVAAVHADRWTPEEKQFFENAFSRYNDVGTQTFFEFVASELPYKSMEEIKDRYLTFFNDFEMENPPENNDVVGAAVTANDHDQQHHQVPQEDDSSDKEATLNGVRTQVGNNRPRRRRGVPWTEGEHQLFLMGLNRFGKGDWKSISRYYVVSKTPTQVASHAQKYFSRRNSTIPMERRRPSINDIQTVNLNPRTRTTTTVTTTHQINNDVLAYYNNHQAVGSSSMPFHYPEYTFGSPTFSNNSNGNFGRFNMGEASSSNSFILGQNNNNNIRRPVSPRPFLSTYLSSIRGNNCDV